MKRALFALFLAVAGACLFALGWICRSGHTDAGTQPGLQTLPLTSAVKSTLNSLPLAPPTVTSSDYLRLKASRAATLQANPDLQAKYRAILQDLDSQQKKLESAMIDADPKVAPIIAKMNQLRQLKMTQASNPSATRQ